MNILTLFEPTGYPENILRNHLMRNIKTKYCNPILETYEQIRSKNLYIKEKKGTSSVLRDGEKYLLKRVHQNVMYFFFFFAKLPELKVYLKHVCAKQSKKGVLLIIRGNFFFFCVLLLFSCI